MDIRSFEDSIKLLGRQTVRRFASLSGLYCRVEMLYTFAASAQLTMCVDTRLTIFAARAIPVTRPALLRHILQPCSRKHGKEMPVAGLVFPRNMSSMLNGGASNHTHSIIFGRHSQMCSSSEHKPLLGEDRHRKLRNTRASWDPISSVVHALHSVQAG